MTEIVIDADSVNKFTYIVLLLLWLCAKWKNMLNNAD